MAIDREISARADAYANNPQALQKSYQQSGSVLDLIALERVKRDLEAKRQEVALQMQGNPQTVAEQTLEETKGLIQKDVTDQTSKLLTQNKKAQDSRLRKLAAGQRPNAPLGIPAAAQARGRGAPNQQLAGIGNIPPRSPVNPRGTGIAANRLSNVSYGAKGGIVSFAQGDQVKRLSSEEILKSIDHTPETFAALPADKQAALIKYINKRRAALRPNLLTRGAAAVGDLAFGALGAPFNIAGDISRSTGAIHPDTKFFGEYDPLLLSRAAQTRADDPNLQPLRAEDLVAHDIGAITPQMQPSPTPQSPQIPSTPVPGFDQPAPNTTFQKMLADRYSGLVDRDYTQEPTIDLPDTAYLSADVDSLQPRTAAEMGVGDREADLRAAQKKLTGDVEGIAGQDVAQAWRDKVTAGEDVFGRAGVAGEYDEMVRTKENLYADLEKRRADNRTQALLARAGGLGALSNIGRAAADMNEADLQRAVMQLTDVQGIQERGLDRDYSMANAVLTSADKTETNVTNAIANANNVREKILSTESKELTDLADRWMNADIANMEAGDRRLRMKFDALMEKYGAEVTQRGQNLTAQLANERNAISVLSTLAVSEAQRDELIIRVEDLVRKIDTDYATIAQSAIDQLLLTEAYDDADAEGKQKMQDDIRKEFKLMAKDMAEQFRKAVKEARGEGLEVIQ